MAEPQPEIYTDAEGVQRLRNTEIVLPIVTGSLAVPKPKQKGGARDQNQASHSWAFYVRSVGGVDLTHIISQVAIELHISFANPTRTFLQPPYEVLEEGWGEFDIVAKLNFAPDARCEPVELVHRLRLFAEGDTLGQVVTRGKQVISEQYEEIVFFEPPVNFHTRILAHQPRPAAPFTQLDPSVFLQFDEEHELKKYNTARQKLASVSENLQQRLIDLQNAVSPL